jgi:hypothetical protein
MADDMDKMRDEIITHLERLKGGIGVLIQVNITISDCYVEFSGTIKTHEKLEYRGRVPFNKEGE